ncbi:hypothetical protein DFP73DRAFT_592178 [Morchella snyderi]|nr:hypothetical protein DFP73DRAFT_592178 [Morchella snyderi]
MDEQLACGMNLNLDPPILKGREFRDVVDSALLEHRVGKHYRIINKYASQKMLDSSEKSRWGYLDPADLANFNKRLLEPKPRHFPASLTVDLQIKMSWMYITFSEIIEYASDHLKILTEVQRQLLKTASQHVKDVAHLITKAWDMQAYGHIWMGHFQGPKAALNRFPPEFYKEILDRWCRLRKEVKEEDIQGVRYLDEWMQNFTRRYKTPKTEVQCFEVWTAIHDAGDECHKGEVVEAWRNAINQFRHDKVKVGKIEDAFDGIAARLSSEKLMIKDEANKCGWNSKHSFMVEKKRMFIHISHLMIDLQLRLKMRAHGEQKEFTLSDLEALAKLREDSITAGLAEKAPMGFSGNPINIWFDEIMFYLPYERICSGFTFNWILYCTKLDHIEFSIMFCMSFGIVEEDTRNWFTDDMRRKIPLFITELKAFVKRRRTKKKKGKGAAEKATSLINSQNSNEGSEEAEKLGVLGSGEQKKASDLGRSENSSSGAIKDSEAKKENYKDAIAKDYKKPGTTENIAQISGALKKKQILSRMMRPRLRINGCLSYLEGDHGQSENGDGRSTSPSSPPISEDNFDLILKPENIIVQEALSEKGTSKGSAPVDGVQHLPINHEQKENYSRASLGGGDDPQFTEGRHDDGERREIFDTKLEKEIADLTPVKEDDIRQLSPPGIDPNELETDYSSCIKVNQEETNIPHVSISDTNGDGVSGMSFAQTISSAGEASKDFSKELETYCASCSKIADQGLKKIPDSFVSHTNQDESSSATLEYRNDSANEATNNVSDVHVGTPKIINGTAMVDGAREPSTSSPGENDYKAPDMDKAGEFVTTSEMMKDPGYVVECREGLFKGKETDMLPPSREIIQNVTAETDGMKVSSEGRLLKDVGSVAQNTHEHEKEYIGIVAQDPADPRQREEEYFGYIILSENDNKPPESSTIPFESQYPLTVRYTVEDDGSGGMRPYHPSNVSVDGGMSHAQSQIYQQAQSRSVPISPTVPADPAFATHASVRTQTNTDQGPRDGGRGRGRPPIVG